MGRKNRNVSPPGMNMSFRPGHVAHAGDELTTQAPAPGEPRRPQPIHRQPPRRPAPAIQETSDVDEQPHDEPAGANLGELAGAAGGGPANPFMETQGP